MAKHSQTTDSRSLEPARVRTPVAPQVVPGRPVSLSARPAAPSHAAAMLIQRTAGNRAFNALRAASVKTRSAGLQVGPAHDPLEGQAEQVAADVMRNTSGPPRPAPRIAPAPPVIQRALTITTVQGRPNPVVLDHIPDSTMLSLTQNFGATPEALQVLVLWAGYENRTFADWRAAVDEAQAEVDRRAQGQFGNRGNDQAVANIQGDHVLTPQEFADLPNTGTINPNRVRIAQGGIEQNFRDGRRLTDTVNQLVGNPDVSQAIPRVNIGLHLGMVWAFDTRRVIAHQMAREQNANVMMRYQKISDQELQERVGSIFTARPYMGLVTSVRYEGKHSGSTPYINPLYRNLIQDDVTTNWLYDDYEGFPEMKPANPMEDKEDKLARAKKVIEKEGAAKHSANLKKILDQLGGVIPNFNPQEALPMIKKLYMVNLMEGVEDIVARTFEDAQFHMLTVA